MQLGKDFVRLGIIPRSQVEVEDRVLSPRLAFLLLGEFQLGIL